MGLTPSGEAAIFWRQTLRIFAVLEASGALELFEPLERFAGPLEQQALPLAFEDREPFEVPVVRLKGL